MRRSLVFVLLGAAVVLPPVVAQADDPTREECIDADNDGTDQLHANKLHDARDSLKTCLAAACPAAVRDDCTKVMKQVEDAMPTMVFAVKDADGDDLTNVRLTMDGTLLDDSLAGDPLEIDPGVHTFVFESLGQTVEKHFVVHEGEKLRREEIRFPKPAPAVVPTTEPTATTTATTPPPPPPPATTSAPAATTAPPPAPTYEPAPARSSRGGSNALVPIGFGVAAVGVVVGSVTGIFALSKASSVSSACNGTICPRSVDDDLQTGRTMGNVSTIAFGVAGVGVILGAVGLVVGGHSSDEGRRDGVHASPFVGVGAAGVRGTF